MIEVDFQTGAMVPLPVPVVQDKLAEGLFDAVFALPAVEQTLMQVAPAPAPAPAPDGAVAATGDDGALSVCLFQALASGQVFANAAPKAVLSGEVDGLTLSPLADDGAQGANRETVEANETEPADGGADCYAVPVALVLIPVPIAAFGQVQQGPVIAADGEAHRDEERAVTKAPDGESRISGEDKVALAPAERGGKAVDLPVGRVFAPPVPASHQDGKAKPFAPQAKAQELVPRVVADLAAAPQIMPVAFGQDDETLQEVSSGQQTLPRGHAQPEDKTFAVGARFPRHPELTVPETVAALPVVRSGMGDQPPEAGREAGKAVALPDAGPTGPLPDAPMPERAKRDESALPPSEPGGDDAAPEPLASQGHHVASAPVPIAVAGFAAPTGSPAARVAERAAPVGRLAPDEPQLVVEAAATLSAREMIPAVPKPDTLYASDDGTGAFVPVPIDQTPRQGGLWHGSTTHGVGLRTALVMQNMPDLAAAVARLPDEGPVTVVLAPHELGAVRFEMREQGDRLHVALTVERPETLDILRRHADQLAVEFKQAGFSGATFSFSGSWGGGQDRPPQRPNAAFEDHAVEGAVLEKRDRRKSGLDLRL